MLQPVHGIRGMQIDFSWILVFVVHLGLDVDDIRLASRALDVLVLVEVLIETSTLQNRLYRLFISYLYPAHYYLGQLVEHRVSTFFAVYCSI